MGGPTGKTSGLILDNELTVFSAKFQTHLSRILRRGGVEVASPAIAIVEQRADGILHFDSMGPRRGLSRHLLRLSA